MSVIASIRQSIINELDGYVIHYVFMDDNTPGYISDNKLMLHFELVKNPIGSYKLVFELEHLNIIRVLYMQAKCVKISYCDPQFISILLDCIGLKSTNE